MPKPDFSNHISKIAEMIRVNHAGEYGAKRIYQGQLKFIKNRDRQALISAMLQQEEKHLEYFNHQLQLRRIRPTVLLPIWYIGGYILGAASALKGSKTAMLVTEAVEEVIEQHYQQQIDYLKEHNKEEELLINIEKFQQEEAEHRHTAVKTGSREASFAPLLTGLVKGICRTAIYLSKKI